MRCNYHTHTPRCNHADGTEREYVEQAILAGYTELGFSDHTPYLFDGVYRSRIRMRPEQLADYCAVLQALQKEYADRIRLRIGLECEYYPRFFRELIGFLQDYPISYLILGQHALRSEVDGPWTGRPTVDEADLIQYCSQTREAMETGLFTYFAHPDIFNFVGDGVVYDRHMRALCRRARELDIPLEINLLGMQEGKQYPNPVFWRIAGEEGCAAVLGADAHWPEGVRNDEYEARARALARDCGVPILEQLEDRQFRPIHTI